MKKGRRVIKVKGSPLSPPAYYASEGDYSTTWFLCVGRLAVGLLPAYSIAAHYKTVLQNCKKLDSCRIHKQKSGERPQMGSRSPPAFQCAITSRYSATRLHPVGGVRGALFDCNDKLKSSKSKCKAHILDILRLGRAT